jgi:hypothetical protein
MAENRERITQEAPEGGTDQEMAATVYRLWDQLLPRKTIQSFDFVGIIITSGIRPVLEF